MGARSVRPRTLYYPQSDAPRRDALRRAALDGSPRRPFYFHCAPEGEKLDCIRANPIVALSAVSRCSARYEEEKNNFTEYYRSAMAVGRAEIVEDAAEKIQALRLICERFLPAYMARFDEAVARSLARTAIVRITLTEPPVGKSKP